MTAKEHNKLVGIFLLAHGGLQALIMIFMGFIYGVLGSAMLASAKRDEEAMVGGIFLGVVAVLVVVSTILILPQLIGGWKMLKERPGARTWGIIASIVAMLNIPLGTAAGIYGVWFLFGEEGKKFYLGGAPQQPMFNAPPPNNWQ
jgi:hypothetical protein